MLGAVRVRFVIEKQTKIWLCTFDLQARKNSEKQTFKKHPKPVVDFPAKIDRISTWENSSYYLSTWHKTDSHCWKKPSLMTNNWWFISTFQNLGKFEDEFCSSYRTSDSTDWSPITAYTDIYSEWRLFRHLTPVIKQNKIKDGYSIGRD